MKLASTEAFNGPPPSREYICFLEKTLLRTREAFVEALHDTTHVERETKRWKVLRKFFFKMFVEAPMDSSSDHESVGEFFHKLGKEEEAVKQKEENK